MSALLGSSSLCRRGPLVHTLSLFHHLEDEEEEREEGERPGERGHLLVHLGLGRRHMRLDLSTPLAVSIREESSVLPLVSDTSGLVFRRPILEALLVNRQV